MGSKILAVVAGIVVAVAIVFVVASWRRVSPSTCYVLNGQVPTSAAAQ